MHALRARVGRGPGLRGFGRRATSPSTAKRIVKKKGPTIIKKSAAKSQYGKPTKKKVKKKVNAKKKVKAKKQVRRAGRPRFTG